MSTEILKADIIIPPVPAKERWSKYLFWMVLAGLLAWSFMPAEMYRASSLITDAGNMGSYASGFLSPNFKDWRYYLSELITTVQIAVWGTFLAVIVGMPLSLLCSNNVAPPWIVQPMRVQSFSVVASRRPPRFSISVSNDAALRSSEALKSSETGAAAHMSLHLHQQCQRAADLNQGGRNGQTRL